MRILNKKGHFAVKREMALIIKSEDEGLLADRFKLLIYLPEFWLWPNSGKKCEVRSVK